MRRRFFTLSAAALTLGLLGTLGGSPALADAPPGLATKAAPASAKGSATSLAAVLSGDQEVADPHGKAVGDDNGKAIALVKVKGDRITFSMKWQGVQAPAAAHIHVGEKGQNGDVKVPLIESAMPKTVRSAAGQVTVEDAETAKAITEHPSGFYVNLHTKEFPDGAVRGQLKTLDKSVNPLDIIKAGEMRALASGFQEFTDDGQPLAGDLDGFGVAFVQPKHDKAYYSVAWLNIGTPQAAHVHEGGTGKNGDVRFPLFTEPMPKNIFAVSGVVGALDPEGLKHIAGSADDFYFNLHNEEFANGAIRGQLSS